MALSVIVTVGEYMKKLALIIASVLLIVFSVGCLANNNENIMSRDQEHHQTAPKDPERETILNNFEFNYDEWDLSPIPAIGSTEWRDANWSKNGEWRVSLENDRVMVSESRNFDAYRFDLPDGYFFGEDLGEWGGILSYYPKEGEGYVVENCDATGMFLIGNDLYLLEGKSYLIPSDGHVYNVKKTNGKWKLGGRLKLNGSPMAFTRNGDVIYVVTDMAIIEMHKRFQMFSALKLTVLAEHGFMTSLYPDSVVQLNDILYIGMRGGILTFNLADKEAKWYIKKGLNLAD